MEILTDSASPRGDRLAGAILSILGLLTLATGLYFSFFLPRNAAGGRSLYRD